MADTKDVLEDWYQRVAVTQKAHYISADRFGRRSYWLGVPVIVLTTLVGTSVFATLQEQPDISIQIAVGLASVLAAVLAGLQTFLGYAERAERHRVAGAKYGAVGRELEILMTATGAISQDATDRLLKRLDDLALESPNNPQRIHAVAGAEIREKMAG